MGHNMTCWYMYIMCDDHISITGITITQTTLTTSVARKTQNIIYWVFLNTTVFLLSACPPLPLNHPSSSLALPGLIPNGS